MRIKPNPVSYRGLTFKNEDDFGVFVDGALRLRQLGYPDIMSQLSVMFNKYNWDITVYSHAGFHPWEQDGYETDENLQFTPRRLSFEDSADTEGNPCLWFFLLADTVIVSQPEDIEGHFDENGLFHGI